MGVKPQYEFGFGLSYTKFHYDNLKVQKTPEGVQVNLTVENIGDFDGSEVIQVYLAKPKTENYSDNYRSPQDLRGFTKVFVPRDRKEEVSVTLTDLDFSYWNTTTHLFTVEPGHYGVRVGASSRDIRLDTTIEI
jgi:beta-glucosidase